VIIQCRHGRWQERCPGAAGGDRQDSDGIPDADDACPEQAGPAGNTALPPGVPGVIVSATSLEILDRVHFASGKALIEPRSYALLDQVAAVIQSHPALLLIQVEGHTDDRGGSSYNLLLSQQRATAVADYLVSRGVSRDRLVARGFGPTHPVGTNGTAEGGRRTAAWRSRPRAQAPGSGLQRPQLLRALGLLTLKRKCITSPRNDVVPPFRASLRSPSPRPPSRAGPSRPSGSPPP
jgi:outer membrane protein OmpA-like peptidoglycan-associated protein